ncbi:MAG: RNA-binding protein [Lachnospiraceae bacterium]|jgi:RNA-binding protein YlmH
MEKDELLEKRLLELERMAYQRGIVTFSDFLGLHELHIANCRKSTSGGVTLESSGGYEMSERQMVVFIPDALSYSWTYPICCVHISPQSVKFSEPLTHRDYLGAILNLGIDRGKIGDILVNEKGAYVFCHEKIADFLVQELCRVRHTTVTTSVVKDPGLLPKLQLESIQGTVASVRLDSVIAMAFSASRSSMLPLIESGRVFVNGKMVVSNGYVLKEKDIVSVRGKGKFQFETILNKTKKNRYSILLYRYV